LKLGLSLSLCIKDIIEGREVLEPDTVLVTGTKARTESEWNYLLQQYSILYWKADAEKAIEIVNKLKAEGRIVQQRLEERRWVSI